MKALIYLMAIGVAAGAYAAGRQAPLFTDIDTDNNQQITQQELDTFHQNRMSEQELQGRRLKNANMGPNIDVMDTDGDGVLSVNEFKAMQNQNQYQNLNKRENQNQNLNKRQNKMKKNVNNSFNKGPGMGKG